MASTVTTTLTTSVTRRPIPSYPLHGARLPTSLFASPTSAPPSATSSPLSTQRHQHFAHHHHSDGLKPVLAAVLPIFFGAILLLVGLYAFLQWHHRRRRAQEQEQQRKAARLRRMTYGGGTTGGIELVDATDDRFEERELDADKPHSVVAQPEDVGGPRTNRIPRKPPPAYEP
ncbi:hypothetical protein JCM10207_004186 [Rhodosporidiobolus poonsookiae]